MPLLLASIVLAFLLGLLFGSFGNVLITRLPLRENIAYPRSHCRDCVKTIRWYDNLPLVSFVLLRGRCRHCRATISWRYPAVESVSALWFALVVARTLAPALATHTEVSAHLLPPGAWPRLLLTALALCALGLLLIALAVIDWQHHLLPNPLTLSGILLGLLFTCAEAALLPTGAYDIHFDPRRNLRLRSPGSFVARGDVFLTGTEHLIYGRVVAILGAALILLLVRWLYHLARKREGLGLGDAKLLGMVAAFLGFWPAVLSLFAGTLAAAVFGIVLLLRGRAHAATALPFGSFLAAGGLFSALCGPAVIAWYRSLL